MTKQTTVERLKALRANMRKAGVDAYLIPTSDFHDSEYTGEYFKVREFFSGFTGSYGDLLVTMDGAFLWTDGRYFIQAEKELEGSGITLMRMGMPGVETVGSYIRKNLPAKAVLGFDGRTVTASRALALKKELPSHRLSYKKDLSKGIFERPPFPASEVVTLTDETAGESSINRISRIREILSQRKCDAILLTRLEDIAYLYNIRAKDIEHTPVAMAYSYITSDKAYVFLMDENADTGYPGVIVRSYDEIYDFLKSDKVSGTVLLDERSVNYRLYKIIKKRVKICPGVSPVRDMKAVKNQVEISHIKDIYLKDSLQLTRFIKWISTTDTHETEMSAAGELLKLRKEIPEFNDLSFKTIAAYGDNAAMIHYEPSAEHDREIEKKGLLMVDSGGQYEGGTTDVTRTIVMGELTDEEKEAFTLTVCGMLRLMNARFIKGVSGVSLDVLAREKMWKQGIDYKHGTGHGIGYMLGVHEGPQSIRTRSLGREAELRPGMLVSDEPGIYREGKFGVRTENILLVMEDCRTDDGVFYRFYCLTQVPIDHKGMDYGIMSSDEIEMYEAYQKEVCRSLSPLMSDEEKEWLYSYCGNVTNTER
ncbi:MAG: aminopeptidase P family protein [Lachnospiraceae bacterium]|nr:aminopeptidase P family protein [Lachnospiraceae bacterium]